MSDLDVKNEFVFNTCTIGEKKEETHVWRVWW